MRDSFAENRQKAAFIVGAPRCGTTAMSRYLGDHPSVCLSRPKETHFFLTAVKHADFRKRRKRYLRRFFHHCSEAESLILDGSVSYLYEPEAGTRALEMFPEARFIVMLRNPLEMLPSYHQRLLYYRQETERHFEQAWNLQSVRAGGTAVPVTCSDPRVLQYRDVGRLGYHLQRFVESSSPERCLWLFLDDVKEDALGTYRRALNFLGLTYDGRTSFPQKNMGRSFRNRLLQNLYAGAYLMPFMPVGGYTSVLYDRFRRYTKPLRSRIKRHNIHAAKPEPLSERMLSELRHTFREDILLLSNLTGRDLSHWLQPPE